MGIAARDEKSSNHRRIIEHLP